MPDKQLKILIISRYLIDQGSGRYAADLINQLKFYYHTDVIVSEFDHKYLKDEKLKIHRLADFKSLKNPLVNFWYSYKYRKLARQADFIFYTVEAPYIILFSWFNYFSKKIFFIFHGTFAVSYLDNWKFSRLLKKIYARAEKIFCVSNFTKEQVLKRVALNNLEVISNGVDFEKFKNPPRNQKNFRQGDKKIILGVGVLKDRKGYHVTIPAVAEVIKKINIKYYIVGNDDDRPYRAELMRLISENRLENNVKILGNINDNDLLNLYHQADLFVLTPIVIKGNKFEGFGLVYLEAGAAKKPVIGTFGCGAQDAIIDGHTGILVPQKNIQATAQAIIKILENPEMSRRMGEANYRLAQGSSWESIAKKYISFFPK